VLADDTSNRVQIATLPTILTLKSPKHPMPYVLIIHEVEDYPAWKQIFDAAADLRREAGERDYQVLKYANNPNQVVHFSSWMSLAAARRFFESPQLVQIRAEAGVKSPEFIYLEQLDSGSLGNRE
jgi:quinol monooxygenase YgiN